ncbi:MAG: hypothetical protein ACLS9K_09055 [Lachnospira eligens]
MNSNNEIKDNPDIYYQSAGSKLNHPASGRFPLNFTYPLVKYFDGPNDGLVEKNPLDGDRTISFLLSWQRGISHGDMIDLNRRTLKDLMFGILCRLLRLKKMGFSFLKYKL